MNRESKISVGSIVFNLNFSESCENQQYKILNVFLNTFPTKMKLTKCSADERNETRKAKKDGRRESEK